MKSILCKLILRKALLMGMAAGVVFTPLALAETPEERGLAIALEVENRDSGWHDASAKMLMILTSENGEKSTRNIRQKMLEVEGDGDKGLSIFDSPRDIKGTGFLSYTHAIKADEQWLYLPALARVKRIASNNKSGPFVGSQFSYEDISSFEIEKFTYKYLREEQLNGRKMFVVENYPNYKYSGYSRLITWIDQERYIPIKIEYYDRKNQLLKTQILSEYKQYLNQYWRALRQKMENHNNGKITLLEWNDYAFNTGLTEKDFRRNVLRRSR